MTKTPRTDAVLSKQGFSTLDEATNCLNEWVDFARKLDRPFGGPWATWETAIGRAR